MHSIRTKTTLLTVCAVIVSMTVATLLGVIAIRNVGNNSSEQMLLLMCETGEKNLDFYFEGVEQSVEIVSQFVESDLDGLEPEKLEDHMERVNDIFNKTASNTNGVLTYYYRIDPAVSDTVKGFWYVNLDGNGFKAHTVTDITLYDTEDTSGLVWFTVPKATGRSIWLPPYITDNLDVRVISYNVPIYWEERFIGVVGIEIDYSMMAEQVNNIRLYDNGYAFLNDEQGNIVYHPRIDVTQLSEDERPRTPEGLISDSTFIRYRYDGVEKQAVWLPLSNGMRLNVTVPIYEINRNWRDLIKGIIGVSVVLLIAFVGLALHFSGRITKPLRALTEAAEQVNEGNYDVELNYGGSDEVGLLTQTFSRLISHLKIQIGYLNDLAYADALTSVRNKGAYDSYIRQLQVQLSDGEGQGGFGIGFFDCDDLKAINDRYGHDRGDVYLKTASQMICRVFQHSPVFRIGGDEFAVILQREDYQNREALIARFREESDSSCASAENEWEQVRVAMGIALYDPRKDRSVDEVARRADALMYEDKKRQKAKR